MKGLKRTELEEGVVYRCLLSGRTVLVDSVAKAKYGAAIVVYWYNIEKGRFEEIPVRDYQLAEIEE